jgi:hypothetical protein
LSVDSRIITENVENTHIPIVQVRLWHGNYD